MPLVRKLFPDLNKPLLQESGTPHPLGCMNKEGCRSEALPLPQSCLLALPCRCESGCANPHATQGRLPQDAAWNALPPPFPET